VSQRPFLYLIIGLTMAVVATSLFVAGISPQQTGAITRTQKSAKPHAIHNVADTSLQATTSEIKPQKIARAAPATTHSTGAKPIFYPAQQRYAISPGQVPALLDYAKDNDGIVIAEQDYLLYRLFKQCRQPISDKVFNQQLDYLEQRLIDKRQPQSTIESQKQRLIDRYLSCQQLSEITIDKARIRQRLEIAAEAGLAIAQVDLFMQYNTAEQRLNPQLLFSAREQCSIDGFIALMQFYSQDDNNPEQDIDTYSHLAVIEKLLGNYQAQPPIAQMLQLRKQLLLDQMYLYEQQQAVQLSEQYYQQYCQ
jgi:hypothetical protein